MNRRSFFKVVTGFIAGIFATSGKKRSGTKLICGGKNGTLCPRCKFNTKWIDVRDYGFAFAESNQYHDDLEIAIKRVNINPKDDSKMIQEAIDLAKDGGTLHFAKGTYNIKRTITV